jgi:hypothetical protein
MIFVKIGVSTNRMIDYTPMAQAGFERLRAGGFVTRSFES